MYVSVDKNRKHNYALYEEYYKTSKSNNYIEE